MSNKVPQIRFTGYSDAWVQRNLGEVVQKVKSYSLSRDVETEDDTGFEYIHYGDIHTQKADVIDGNTKLPSIVPGDYDLIQVGDVIVADASEDYLGIAEPAVVVNKPTENLVAGLHTIAIRPNGIHPLFLYYLLHTQLFKHFGYRTGTGLKVFGISYPNLAKFTFAMPTLDEQKAIANTLRDMDNLIAANQRKLDLLKEQKKGYLQKMVPKNGAKVPELRFEGFVDDWEERKVKDIFKITRGQVLAATETSEEKSDISPFPVYSSQTKNNGLMGYYKDYLFDTAITWTTDGANAGTVSYRSGRFYSTNVNGVLISDKGYTNKAISEILNLEAWKWVSHVGNPKLMNNVMGDISIMIPSSFEEQDRLSDFLNQLDDTIALHQRKLDLLKKQKKGFLQKMFV